MAVEFNKNAIYGLHEVEEMLCGIVTMNTFLERLELRNRRTFRDCLTGAEILRALAEAKPFSELNQASAADVVDVMQGRGRGGRKGADPAPVRRLGAKDLET